MKRPYNTDRYYTDTGYTEVNKIAARLYILSEKKWKLIWNKYSI